MLNVIKTVAAAAIIGSFGAHGSSLAFTPIVAGADACDVPICDIQETLDQLMNMSQNQRYNYANNLVLEHAKTKDVKVLKNLIDFGRKLQAISIEMGDEDWVSREAGTLANNAILNLAKYSAMNGEAIAELFMQLDSATKRYEVIQYWHQMIFSLEDVEILEEIISFGTLAKDYSAKIGDEPWIQRAAASMISDASVKLVALEPVHEGVYEVRLNKTDRRMLGFDRIVVLDSTSSKNLTVHFLNSEINRTAFSFNHATIIGNKVSGTNLSTNGPSSSFQFNFDRTSGEIQGTIQTTRGQKVSFIGERKFTVQDLLKGESPRVIEKNDIIGTMKGAILGVEGELSIKSFSANTYSASFVSNNGQIILDFQGKIFPKKGIISLTHNDKIKLVLAFRSGTSGVIWKGATFSTQNGEVNPAYFKPFN
ncbi:MAG: hypothetical protein CME67_07565 [Halobacteriovoraceae bacterium]|nr:hypothetical protein [Halobacteriovoraceae bacterium]|tara:strand:+ start:232 stop:1500 length:1269 start_codon:yes stop_codon:yes gene_type:complete